MALVCLESLLRCSAEPLALRLHDDGTLRREDLDRLEERLGRFALVSRAEADEAVAGVLARRPALAAFRRENPLARKLIDAVLLAGEELAYCDTDVLFLRRFAGLFRLPPAAGALFMSDRQNAYSVRSWHLLARPRLALAAARELRCRGLPDGGLRPGPAGVVPGAAGAPLRPGLGGADGLGPARLAGRLPAGRSRPGRHPGAGPAAPRGDGGAGRAPFREPGALAAPRLYSEACPPERSVAVEIRTRPAQRCRALDLAIDEARRVVRRVGG